jgi:hypothetical protein
MRRPSDTIALVRLGVGYPGTSRLDHARRDFDAIASAGASLVVLDASEEEVLERPEHLAALVAEMRDRSIEVRVAPRGVLGLFAGGGASVAIGRDPTIRQRLTDGTSVPAACPNNPATGAWLERWLLPVVALRPDSIAWVEPRLWVPVRDPLNTSRRDAWACACDVCRDAWAHGRHDAPGGVMPAAFTGEVREFRRRSLVGLLEPALARAHRAGIRNVLTVAPATGDHPDALSLDDLVALVYVNGLGTEPSETIDDRAPDHVAYWAGRIVKATRGRATSHVRLRIDGVRADREAQLAAAVEAAAAAGIDELVVRSWPDAEPREAGDVTERAARLPAAAAWRLLAEAALAVRRDGMR